jgi:hypothetical protein
MKIPGADRLLVEASKVTDYLLSREHPVGRFKAVFFNALGYSREGWTELQRDLARTGLSEEASLGESNQYGQKYKVAATIRGPSGREAEVITVWIVRRGEDFPRFVTAHPGEKS